MRKIKKRKSFHYQRIRLKTEEDANKILDEKRDVDIKRRDALMNRNERKGKYSRCW